MNKLDCLVYLNIRTKEEWKTCTRNDNYAVSNFGRVRRIDKGNILKFYINKCGYVKVGLWKDNEYSNFLAHRLIAEAFFGPCPKKHEVNHIDGDKENNCEFNLEYVKHYDNVKHAMLLKLHKFGSNNGMSKLDENNVLKIRKLYKTGKYYQWEIAKRFGITDSQVSRIVNDKFWKHI